MAGLLQEIDIETEGGVPAISDICLHFKWVLPAIQEILDEQPQLTYTASQVATACKDGEATLWISDEGFVISSAEVDVFTGDKTFLVWIAWAKKRGDNCVIKYYDFFRSYAEEAGFKHMEVRTPILELAPYLLAEGWQVDTVVYTRRI